MSAEQNEDGRRSGDSGQLVRGKGIKELESRPHAPSAHHHGRVPQAASAEVEEGSGRKNEENSETKENHTPAAHEWTLKIVPAH
ncbi:MAG: hypothetical protein DMG49_11995 [Acidobacteria bacterium]|nr:MAG: hypothetical protein DMG49_11995 [Acidobacteriota bacterium]